MAAVPWARDSRETLLGEEAPRSRGRAAQTFLGSAAACAAFAACAAAFVAGRRSAAPPAAQVALAAAGVPTTLWQPRLVPAYQDEPLAKSTVRRFDAYLMQEAAFATPQVKLVNVKQWLAPDFLYETVGFPSSYTPQGWCLSGEEGEFRTAFNASVFSQMLFFGTDAMATTTSYGTAFWAGSLFGVPAPRKWIYFRVTDFYTARRVSPTAGQLVYNFMMIDFADLLRRVGRPVLPPAALPEGLFLSAAADDGVPAPLSVVAKLQDAAAAERVAHAALREDWLGSGPGASHWHANLTFYGPGGIGVARGVGQYREHVLAPFHRAFAGREVEAKISGCEGNYCGVFGELHGRHVGPWLGLAASGKKMSVRFAFHYRVVDGFVQEGWALFDLPSVFTQLGLDFFKLAAEKQPALA